MGMVVKSGAGHDSGRYFAVITCEGGRVLIADGKERKIAKPKAKNVKHLTPTGKTVDVLTDKKLRTALRVIAEQINIAEESG